MGRSWIYKEIASGKFPAPIKIGRASAWDSSELDAWFEALIDGGTSKTAPRREVH